MAMEGQVEELMEGMEQERLVAVTGSSKATLVVFLFTLQNKPPAKQLTSLTSPAISPQ